MGYLDGCTGKVGFDLRVHAKRAAERIAGRSVYRCKHCGKWHVGNTKWAQSAKQRWAKQQREPDDDA